MQKIILVASVIATFGLAGCAANPGVAKISENTFMVSRQAASGFSGLGSLKVKALKEAEQHCNGMGKSIQLLSTNDSMPPYVLGNFPRTEIQFSCV